MYRIPGFDQIVNEHFDITHNETRRVLLNINEADQNQVLTALTSKLYDHIVTKVDDIDYGDIPNTKGDITKLDSYTKLVDCIQVMHDILVEYKQDLKPIKVIEEALENIKDRKDLFERGFRYNVEFVMVTYSTMVLSIISSTSFMIATCIEFIKTPNQETFDIMVDKVALVKTKQNLLFTNLEKFNKSCSSEQLDNCLEFIMKNKVQNLTGAEIGLVVGGIALVGLLLNIIPILRELIFFFYHSRTRVSDYFDIQADLLQMNAHNLQSNESKDKKEREKIAKKQLKIVEMFRKVSNALAVSNKESEVKATKEITESDKKYKTDEVVEEMPDSASSALF